MASMRPRSKWRQPFTSFARPEDPETKTGTGQPGANPLLGLAVVSAIYQSGGGQRKKKRPGGRRKPLKRLDPDKEIKVNSFDFLWLDLAGFCQIWGNSGLALKNQIDPPPSYSRIRR
jgi:hypothetical protein